MSVPSYDHKAGLVSGSVEPQRCFRKFEMRSTVNGPASGDFGVDALAVGNDEEETTDGLKLCKERITPKMNFACLHFVFVAWKVAPFRRRLLE